MRRESRKWEHTRVIAYNSLVPHRDPKKGFPSIKEFMPLPTDIGIDENSEAARLQKKLDEYKESLQERGITPQYENV